MLIEEAHKAEDQREQSDSRHHTSYVSIRQHTSAYVSIRQHTSAYVSIRQSKMTPAPAAASYDSCKPLHTGLEES
jgi:hypothetical protein